MADGSHKRGAVSSNAPSSYYMRRLCPALQRLGRFVGTLPRCAVLSSLKQALAQRVLLLFVRHAAMIRPISETGKLRLTQDMPQLELALAPLHKGSLSSLGWAYCELRAFRQLLFVETAVIAKMPRHELLKLRPSTLAHHLICRSHEVTRTGLL